MNIEDFRNYCLSKKEVSEEFPFDNNTLVFKVCGKIFALADVENFGSFNLKCQPEWAIELREQYPDDVKPGYHMNKKHWNTINSRGMVDDNLSKKLIDHSYNEVVKGLPKKIREELK